MDATPSLEKRNPICRMMDCLAEIGIKTKVRILLLTVGLLPTLAFLILLQDYEVYDVSNLMALYVSSLVIFFFPLTWLIQDLFVLRQAGNINEYVAEVQQGRKPYVEIPPEEGEENDFLQMKRNIFWMVRSLALREDQLKSTMSELQDSRRQILESIEYAGRIQRSFLPCAGDMERVLGEHLLIWEPRDEVGGDAYWIREVDGGFFVAVTDCTGHGVPGAFLTLIVNTLLDHELEEQCRENPALLLEKMNRSLKQTLVREGAQRTLGDGYDGSVCFVDRRNKMLHYAGANGIAFLLRNDDMLELKGSKSGVGFSSRSSHGGFFSQSVSIDDVVAVYLATDGFTDQVGGPMKLPFGRKRFRAMLHEHSSLPFGQQQELIQKTIKNYRGGQAQRDDMTLLGFSCMGG
jgi:serine phosphatase RsbU (regulator of sigma subunit)